MVDSSLRHGEENTFTDEDIQQLLIHAEIGLRSSGSSAPKGTSPHLINGLDNFTHPLIPRIPPSQSLQPYIHQKDNVATVDTSCVIHSSQKGSSDELWSAEELTSKKLGVKEKQDAGLDWFNMPKTRLTPELKRDLQLLRMRTVLDPKRHYKKEDARAKPPEFSQIGTVIEGSAEFFSARIAKKDRKNTFVQEAMALEHESGQFKARYNAIQVAKTSGKRSYYKRLQSNRRR